MHIVTPPRRPRSSLETRASAPSSRGLGHGPFKAATRVRIPSGSSGQKYSRLPPAVFFCPPCDFSRSDSPAAAHLLHFHSEGTWAGCWLVSFAWCSSLRFCFSPDVQRRRSSGESTTSGL